jgi:hypothetical protein
VSADYLIDTRGICFNPTCSRPVQDGIWCCRPCMRAHPYPAVEHSGRCEEDQDG